MNVPLFCMGSKGKSEIIVDLIIQMWVEVGGGGDKTVTPLLNLTESTLASQIDT